MESRIQEAIRYLGYGRNAVDQETLDMVSEAFLQLDQCAKKRSVCRIFQLEQMADDRFKIGKLDVKSKGLGKNLKGCSSVAVFGATLGIEVDRLITREVSVQEYGKGGCRYRPVRRLIWKNTVIRCQERTAPEKEKEALLSETEIQSGIRRFFDIEYQKTDRCRCWTAAKNDRTDTDGQLYDGSVKISDGGDRDQPKHLCRVTDRDARFVQRQDCLYRRNTA